jgi:ATP-binding cassette subfamily F protein 3
MVDEVINDTAAVNFRFTFKQPSGRHVVTLKNVSKSYGDLTILNGTDAAIERGDKIALIGANGKGKSTLLRIISGSEPIEGERTIGHNVISGFFAQHQLEALHVENEILDELKQAGTGKLEQELRNVLGCFLFSDEDVFKKIKVLSGGEKSRVALAKTLISEANFLLLDEPTNHLDFISENILIQALEQYKDTFVVVSHNRHFISKVANKIWYIEDCQIKEYPGTYDEYEYWRKQNVTTALPPPPKKEKKPEPSHPPKEEASKQLKALQNELKKVEQEVAGLEKEKLGLEGELTAPEIYNDEGKLEDVQLRFTKVSADLEGRNTRWEEIMLAIEDLSEE